MQRGRKRKFYTLEAIKFAEQGLTCQEIATELKVHYNSIRVFLKSHNIKYEKGKVGRPKKGVENE